MLVVEIAGVLAASFIILSTPYSLIIKISCPPLFVMHVVCHQSPTNDCSTALAATAPNTTIPYVKENTTQSIKNYAVKKRSLLQQRGQNLWWNAEISQEEAAVLLLHQHYLSAVALWQD